MDNISVHGSSQQEHDKCLLATLEKLWKCYIITLNQEKNEFSKTSVKLGGHVIDHEGIKLDPEKVWVICEMSKPKSFRDLRRFLDMCNQLNKISPELQSHYEI